MKSGDVPIRISSACPCPSGSPNIRLALVVLSVGIASHFMLYLDSVMDNLLPAARPFLMTIYKNKDDGKVYPEVVLVKLIQYVAADIAWELMATWSQVSCRVRLGMLAATIGRFINGCGQGIVQTAGSVMLAELPPIQYRGMALATLVRFTS
ncbi:unnamed protein product [Strongylus vulgaris]|uniref:Uncharacterized protein n=1 Tax=Strongylus vulgaris TaxID=40348 RepID=A0A3P7L9A4_STRVU|nr:unnamed protein product [Strongylus vulgaris]